MAGITIGGWANVIIPGGSRGLVIGCSSDRRRTRVFTRTSQRLTPCGITRVQTELQRHIEQCMLHSSPRTKCARRCSKRGALLHTAPHCPRSSKRCISRYLCVQTESNASGSNNIRLYRVDIGDDSGSSRSSSACQKRR